jgi:hypothetical protein
VVVRSCRIRDNADAAISTVLFWIIVVAGVVAVAANTFYPGVKEAEKKAALGKNAVAILSPELTSNRELLDEDKRIINNGWSSFDFFDVSAWEAISRGGLLLGLDSDYVNKILNIYKFIYKSNSIINVITEHTSGTSSSLTNSIDTVNTYKQKLSIVLEKLNAAFGELDKRPNSASPPSGR